MSSVFKNCLTLQLIYILLVTCVVDAKYVNKRQIGSSKDMKVKKVDNENAKITYQQQMITSGGDYYYAFQTDNGITSRAAGNYYGVSGVVQYVSLEGIPITMTYVADANGYHPVGDHIPKTPDYILRSLEYIRTHAYH